MRGRPRRSRVVPAVVVGVAGAVARAAAGDVDAGTPVRAAAVTGAAGAGGTEATAAETSPAGGQGSPPGTRGRPRRSCRGPASAFTAGGAADTAVARVAVS
ncbi:hypothetical protein [Arthrobacter sp. UYEF3]|uniref:hypothetical protein n=1 Tax=Arthrobacter sp. UYEF3 TaxID=1756365 RepID=UPI003399F7E8